MQTQGLNDDIFFALKKSDKVIHKFSIKRTSLIFYTKHIED